MFRYDAVLFDMDGTLLDTADDITDALNQTLMAHEYPTHDRSAVVTFLGNGSYRLMQRALPVHTTDTEIRQALAQYQQQYNAHQNQKTHPYTGVLPMLAALDEAGLKLAVISNKPDTNVKQLTKEHFGSLIHIAVGARDSMPLKPAADMLYHALQKLNVKHERSLYIGDCRHRFSGCRKRGNGLHFGALGLWRSESAVAAFPAVLCQRSCRTAHANHAAAGGHTMNSFFAYLDRLKLIRRWGLMRNAIPENDMEHSMQCALITHALAALAKERYHVDIEPQTAATMALYHDAGEVLTGRFAHPP